MQMDQGWSLEAQAPAGRCSRLCANLTMNIEACLLPLGGVGFASGRRVRQGPEVDGRVLRAVRWHPSLHHHFLARDLGTWLVLLQLLVFTCKMKITGQMLSGGLQIRRTHASSAGCQALTLQAFKEWSVTLLLSSFLMYQAVSHKQRAGALPTGPLSSGGTQTGRVGTG